MKKLLSLALFCALNFFNSANAQTEKGTKYIGGTVSFNGVTSKVRLDDLQEGTQRIKNHEIRPEFQMGAFLNHTTLVGLGFRYGLVYDKYSTGTDNQLTSVFQSLQFQPFIRKYRPIGDRWSIFLHGEIGPTYSWHKQKYSENSQEGSNEGFWNCALSIKPGVGYTLPKGRWVLEGYVNVLSLNASYNIPKNGASQFTFSSGFSTAFPSYFTIRIAKYIPTK